MISRIVVHLRCVLGTDQQNGFRTSMLFTMLYFNPFPIVFIGYLKEVLI